MSPENTSSTRNTPRRYLKPIVVTACAAVIALGSACSGDSVTAPSPSGPSNGLISSLLGTVSKLLTPVTGLLRTTVLSEPVVGSITVDANGGVLRMPSTGLTLTIPRNAVSSRTTIRVTAIPGRTVAYVFEPHGIVFKQPLTFTHDLGGTSLFSTATLSGGYFKDASQLDAMTGEALINEQIPARVDGGKVSFDISHFSGYMVSTGRSTSRTSVPE